MPAYSLRIKCTFLPWLQSPAKPNHLLLILPHTSYLHLLCEAESWPSMLSAIECSWFAHDHTLFPSPSVDLRPCTRVLSEDLGCCLQGTLSVPGAFSLCSGLYIKGTVETLGVVCGLWGGACVLFWFLSIFVFTLCACLHVSVSVCVCTCACHGPHVGPRDWTQFIWLGSKHLYLLSHHIAQSLGFRLLGKKLVTNYLARSSIKFSCFNSQRFGAVCFNS